MQSISNLDSKCSFYGLSSAAREVQIIADNLSQVGWSLGCVSAVDSNGRTIWIVDAYRDDRRRFIVHADDKLSAFVELEREALTVTFYLESIPFDDANRMM